MDVDGIAGPVRGRRRGTAWRRDAHGLHVPADAEPAAQLRAWQLLLPAHGCFTHLTGAAIRGWWLLPIPEGLPDFVALKPDDVRPDRDGIRSLRTSGTTEPDAVAGLRLARPTEILLACARDLGLLDLVVLIDAARHTGDVTLDELAAAATARRRGAPALRRDPLGSPEVEVRLGDRVAGLPPRLRDRGRAPAPGLQPARGTGRTR